jgi:hypothetical protein
LAQAKAWVVTEPGAVDVFFAGPQTFKLILGLDVVQVEAEPEKSISLGLSYKLFYLDNFYLSN